MKQRGDLRCSTLQLKPTSTLEERIGKKKKSSDQFFVGRSLWEFRWWRELWTTTLFWLKLVLVVSVSQNWYCCVLLLKCTAEQLLPLNTKEAALQDVLKWFLILKLFGVLQIKRHFYHFCSYWCAGNRQKLPWSWYRWNLNLNRTLVVLEVFNSSFNLCLIYSL